MTIEFHCPHCDRYLKTADDKAGLQANCPGCGEVIGVPRESQLADDAQSGREHEAPPPNQADTKNCPMCGEEVKATAVKCRHCGETLEGRPPRSEGLRPNRGPAVLTLGIIGGVGLLGYLCCLPIGLVGLVCSIIAVVIGNSDLRAIEEGTMDSFGAGNVQGGRIVAICALVLHTLAILAFVAYIVVIFGVLMNQP